MTNDDRAAGNEPTDETAAGSPQSQAGSDGLVQFVRTKGTQVAGRHRDKAERIAETICDLELACEGALSLTQRTARSHRGQWGAALARACSVFLRKMVIGDWNNPSTRLLDDSVVQTFGIGFDRLRRITAERRAIEIRRSIQDGMVKLDEATGRPEATVSLFSDIALEGSATSEMTGWAERRPGVARL